MCINPHRPLLTWSLALAALAVAHEPACAQAESYSVKKLPSLGGTSASALALNEKGDVVGFSNTASGISHPVRWSHAQATDLTPQGPAGQALGINEAGTIVGRSPPGFTATWIDGVYTTLGEGALHGINHHGVRVGQYQQNAWQWTADANLSLPGLVHSFLDEALAVNETGLAVGGSDIQRDFGGTAEKPVYWDSDGVHALPTPLISGEATGVNASGQIVGWSAIFGVASSLALRWDDGQYTILPGLSFNGTAATAINDGGLIVGWSIDEAGARHAVLWNGKTLTDLNTWLGPLRKQRGWSLTSANAINNRGKIVGQMHNATTGEDAAFAMLPR